jgi:hypothetical protein
MGQGQQFIGFLDCITVDGFVEGWAKSREDDFDTAQVGIVFDKKVIGVGLANLFRPDLSSVAVGHGWHAFRICVNADFGKLKSVPLFLIEMRDRSLLSARELPVPPAGIARPPVSTEVVINDNSLHVTDIRSIAGFSKIMDAFVRSNGAERFVERAYCYVLGRPADPDGSKQYSALIASQQLTPLGMIEILFKSEERTLAKWPMLPPSDPSFPFRLE